MKIPIIKGSQFILRPFKQSDKKSQVKNLNNKKILKSLLTVPSPYTLKDANIWIGKNLKEYENKKPRMICFVIDIDGEVVGSIGVHNIEKNHMAEIGYWLAEKHWGKRIMTEAIKLITKFGFEKMNFKRMYAYTFSFNKASQKALIKNGYKFEGELKKHAYKNGKFLNDYLYAKVK